MNFWEYFPILDELVKLGFTGVSLHKPEGEVVRNKRGEPIFWSAFNLWRRIEEYDLKLTQNVSRRQKLSAFFGRGIRIVSRTK